MVQVSTPLISVEELAQRLEEFGIFDLRWSLTDAEHGVRAYEQGHVPGAVFVDLDRDLAADQGDGRHPLPRVGDLVKTLGRLGITRDTPVVVYDDAGGAVAARMWWMLESIGHNGPVRVLDGGLRAWTETGLPLEPGVNLPMAATYPDVAGYTGVVRHDELEGRVVADARAPERYRGDIEPIDPKAGHIPGAVSFPYTGNLEEGRFRDPVQLTGIYEDFPDDGVVSCGSGVNACHTALALVTAGRPMPDVYIGSFSDWSRRELPVSTGDRP